MQPDPTAASDLRQGPGLSSSGMTTRVVRGSLWSISGQAVVIATSLVSTPFVIRLLGAESYGVLALINVLIGYLAFADLGMGAASTRFGSQAHARGDDEGEASVVWTALALSFFPSAMAALTLAVSAPWLAEHALRLPDHLHPAAVSALRVAALGFVARAVSGVLNTPQLVRLRIDLYTLINSGSAVVQVALVPVVLALGGGLVGAVTVGAAVAASTLFVHLSVSRKLLQALVRPRFDAKAMRSLLSFGGALIVSALVAIALMNAEKLFLTRFASVTSLAYYSVAFTVANLLLVLPAAMGQSLLPAFTRLHEQGDREGLQRLYTRALRANLLWAVPLATVVCVLAKPFFTVWAGPEFGRESTVPLYILAAGILFNVMAYIPCNLLLSMGRANLVARIHVAELAPYVLVAALSTYWFGAAGAALAWSLRVIADAALMFTEVNRKAGLSLSLYPNHRVSYAASVLALLMPVLIVSWLSDSSAARTGTALLSLVVYSAIVWSGVLEDDERAWLLGFVRFPARSLIGDSL
ncbi:MAG TPA: flippase [Blastocatellia bacterium]|nr:flippase [Blastocatellia bacterium]